MKRNTLNYIVGFLAGLSFLMVFITGIIKFRVMMNFLGLADVVLPFKEITTIHEWSGLIFGVLVIIHFLLHWRWVVYTTKTILKRG